MRVERQDRLAGRIAEPADEVGPLVEPELGRASDSHGHLCLGQDLAVKLPPTFGKPFGEGVDRKSLVAAEGRDSDEPH